MDGRLLEGLRALGTRLTADTDPGGLTTHVANRIIGCLLYLFCLRDRRMITDRWMVDNGHERMLGEDRWTLQDLWALFEDLNVVFNGTIFAVSEEDRVGVTEDHVDLARRVIRHGEELSEHGSQTSLLDVDLSVVRTETLSAVYEMFFEIQGGKAKDDDGAFYTPPFLVDHVLAKVDEVRTVEPGARVCDCAAGSGMFLVGAYRRMLERVLDREGGAHLPLGTVRDVLRTSIFGIERNPDAALVATFSLFLTMLEYAGGHLALGSGPTRIRDGHDPIFPDLIGRNLLVRDAFGKEPLPNAFQDRFDIVLGNPPWQQVGVIGPLAKAEAETRRMAKRMDRGRASELFFWFCHDNLLAEGGAFGMVLSAKSFLSPGANRFPQSFLEQAGVTGIVNLTHLRRRLFPGAEHPAVAVVGRRARPRPEDPVWIHFPLLSALPLDRQGSPWCIVENAADVETHATRKLAAPTGLFRALMLRPMDRRIATYLDDRCELGEAMTVERLCASTGLRLRRGGPPKQTGLPASFHLGTSPEVHYLVSLGIEEPRDGGGPPPRRRSKRPGTRPATFDSYRVTASALAEASGEYASMFKGDVVAFPRSFRRVDFIERPFAFNSSICALFFDGAAGSASRPQREFLEALAKYLNSPFARYLAALYGRMWIIDRRRFEVSDLEALPTPFTGLDDAVVRKVNDAPLDGLDDVLTEAMGFSEAYRRSYEEYKATRHGVENGRQPRPLLGPPNVTSVSTYCSMLGEELDRFFTSSWRVRVTPPRVEDESGLVAIRFESLREQGERPVGGRAPSMDGRHVADTHYDSDGQVAFLRKPWVAARWLEEQAVADARRVIQRVLTTSGTR